MNNHKLKIVVTISAIIVGSTKIVDSFEKLEKEIKKLIQRPS